ncbi:hypothetical protein Q1695_007591 [Nippostrongylus brasiliensis]|nr:hypothetical protein Q1695_007591 [Nippostrongylus brasiliensis]
MFPFLLHVTNVLITSVETRQAPIVVSANMHVQYISNFDFAKQTFDLIVDMERELKDTSVSLQRSSNPFYDIKFDALESRTLGDLEFTYKGLNVTGMRSREKLTVPCHFSQYFPFDKHICTLRLISRRLPSDRLTLAWMSSPQLSTPAMNIPHFLANEVSADKCDHKSSAPSTSSTTTFVTHACLAVRLEFSRSLCLVFYRFYVPSSMALFLAWLSFYISRTDLTSRMLLVSFSISLQVFICTFFLHSVGLPVSVATPADVWCALLVVQSVIVVTFIFAAIILEAQVRKYRELSVESKAIREDSRSRHERRAMREAMYRKENNHTEKSACSYSTVVGSAFRRKGDLSSLRSARLDILARFVCPAIYIVVTSLYFLLHLLSPYE